MKLHLEKCVAIVTGASRGIGKGIAKSLTREGCKIVICARNVAALESAVDELHGERGEVIGIPVDITEPDAPERLVQLAVSMFGKVDILVNNVGGNRRKAFEDTTDEDWEDIININLLSHIRASRAAIPHMKKASGGSIIFISSIFGREAGGPGLSIYNTTKSALISVSKIMALELAPFKIRVNSVAPGSIRFPGGSWDRRVQADPVGMDKFIKTNLPLGRFGTVKEVADVVTFLASERAGLITGACINVDGGQSHSLI